MTCWSAWFKMNLMNFSLHRFALMLLALSIVTASCKQRVSNYEPPAVVVVGLEGNPTSLDPRLARDAYSTRILHLLFHGLMRLNDRAELVPDLALRVEQPEELTYDFILRDDVFFTGGRRATAHDVEYTLNSLADPELRSPKRFLLDRIESIEVLSDDVIRIVLKEPYAPFLAELTLGIVPEDIAQERGAEFSRSPVGSGPYMLESWEQGGELSLSLNTDYQGSIPKIDRIVFRVIPDDVTRVLALERGEIHLLQNSVPPDDVPLVKNNPRLEVITRPGINYSYLGFNLEDPILSNREVREAIALAIDREPIIHCMLHDTVQEASGLLAPSNWAHETDVETYAYDPDRARNLLDKAGYTDPDGDGPEPRFSLLYKTSQNKTRRWIAEAIAYQLKDVGIKVDVRSYEWGTLFADITSGNFQIYTLTWVGITEPDIYYSVFHSANLPPTGANRGRYKNPEIDKLTERGRTVTDMAERKAIYSKVQKILAHELPYVSLWYSSDVVAMDKRLEGFEIFPGGDFRSLAGANWNMGE